MINNIMSKYFTLAEMTYSDAAIRHDIDNMPTGKTLENLKYTMLKMDEVRDFLKKPIHVSSGYRGISVNAIIGGSNTSAHTLGYAVDFTAKDFGGPLVVCEALIKSGLIFDQIIWEFDSWTHISFDPKARKQVLTAVKQNGKTVYFSGLKK